KKATDEAKAERQRLLDEARKDADLLRAKRQDALRNEQRNLSQEIIRWTQKEVFAITRKALADLASTSLEERMVDVFVHRVRALTGAAKEQLATAFKTSNHTVSVHSAFDLRPAQRTAIESAVKETFGRRLKSSSRPRRSWSAALISPPMDTRYPGASRITWRRWRRAPANFCTSRPSPSQWPKPSPSQRPKPSLSQRLKPSPSQRPKPSPGRMVNLNTGLNRCPRPQRRTIEYLA